MFCGDSRTSIYKRYHKVLRNLDELKELEIIGGLEVIWMKRRAELAFAAWKAEWRKKHPPGRPGRPAKSRQREDFKVCKRIGCGRPPAKNQAFCSPECSPYGHLMADKGHRRDRRA
jgi:hypothetical protein